uniref:Peptidase S1 domain-containing protein n=1 Tax=Anopheles dirus TaxID=7168 RepID=A0A182NCR3_9DIPT
MTDHVQPICLWDAKLPASATRGTIVGFGKTENDLQTDHLQQASVHIVKPMQCFERDHDLQPFMKSTMFCASGKPGVSAWLGDSGGGFYFEEGGKWYVRGIISFTGQILNHTKHQKPKITVFTKVAKYIAWIKQHVQRFQKPSVQHRPILGSRMGVEEEDDVANDEQLDVQPEVQPDMQPDLLWCRRQWPMSSSKEEDSRVGKIAFERPNEQHGGPQNNTCAQQSSPCVVVS